MESVELVSPLVFAGLVLAAAYWDLRFRVIPNLVNVLLLAGGLASAWLLAGWNGAGVVLLHALAALVIGLVL